MTGTRSVVVVGIGNELRGDDGAGLEVVRRLRRAGLPAEISIRAHDGEGLGLLELWEGADAVLLVDAVRSPAPPGRIHSLDLSCVTAPASLGSASSHAIGVVEAIELGRTLGRLPGRVLLYGLEGERFEVGSSISAVLTRELDLLTELVRRQALRLLADAAWCP